MTSNSNNMTSNFNTLDSEKARGGLVSFLSGLLANAVNAGAIMSGADPVVSTIVTLQVFGNLLTYFLDIMMAKREFHGTVLSYRAYAKRFEWFLASFQGPPFHKFVVACIIEAIIVFAAVRRLRELCDRHRIHFRYRDAALAAGVAALSFLLVMNVLRFNWVLHETESLTLNIVILAWMGLSTLVLLLAPNEKRVSLLLGK